MDQEGIDLIEDTIACWHEVGHAIACIHFGGRVTRIGLKETECTPALGYERQSACGGFSAEHLWTGGDVEAVTSMRINSSCDRCLFFGISPQVEGYPFTREQDEEFDNFARSQVVPVLSKYVREMAAAADELQQRRVLDGARFLEIVHPAKPAARFSPDPKSQFTGWRFL